jgi:hypothetical protein
MSVNDFVLNGAMVNGGKAIGSASGELVQIEQNVQLSFKGSGAIISIEQNVQAKASGSIITIQQVVETP